MSALENQVWPELSKENLSSKYEKCRNITEEIYKRINITFQIKKLENAGQSDVSEHSDVIDSNDLSNETDLFACDKTDSLPSSEEKNEYVNINNNVEPRVKDVKKVTVSKRPRKRFRKRVKKHQSKSKASDSDGSSDEAPLSRIVDTQCVAESPESVMGVPGIIILTKDVKPRTQSPEKKPKKATPLQKDQKISSAQTVHNDINRKGGKHTTNKTFLSENTPREKMTIETEKSLKIIIDKTEVEKMITDTLAAKNATNDVETINKQLGQANDKIEQQVGKMIIDTLSRQKPTIVVDEKVGKPIDNVKECKPIEKATILDVKKKSFVESKPCTMCSMAFRGERGLRRHMAITHIISEEKKSVRPEREVKPA
ncbi:uncharacterized protein LOC113234517 [Hyposmocoma kahamanoa]|uniref:uncharacterized protein LOC113234517 n=1 Tax=Hyposmocoma kahamanoa TaxID=1477025 RepID=UPI000E6D8D0C|nr:uncharacterized protein LOC113234517 [Hyposmocoma kahamanoa]